MIEFEDDEVQRDYDMFLMEKEDLESQLARVNRMIQSLVDNPKNKQV